MGRGGVVAALFFLTAAMPIHASSSGLNNIPTADTAGHRVLVFQDYFTGGARFADNNFVAFKAGYEIKPSLRFEYGLDGRTNPVTGASPLAQLKLAYQPDAKGPALCVGVANLAATAAQRRLNAQPYSYFVASQNIPHFARLHGGYALQANNSNSAILGVDRVFRVAGHDLDLRADAIQIDRGTNWAVSSGGIYVFAKHWAVEAWVTQPVHSRPAIVTLKLDLILKDFRF